MLKRAIRQRLIRTVLLPPLHLSLAHSQQRQTDPPPHTPFKQKGSRFTCLSGLDSEVQPVAEGLTSRLPWLDRDKQEQRPGDTRQVCDETQQWSPTPPSYLTALTFISQGRVTATHRLLGPVALMNQLNKTMASIRHQSMKPHSPIGAAK